MSLHSDRFQQEPNTFYMLLEGRLKALYAARDRNTAPEDRWRFRGSWLVLWFALQSCASNDSYDIFRDAKPDETAFLISLLEEQHNIEKTPFPPLRVSQLPTEPYTGKTERDRIDSAFSSVSSGQRTVPKPSISQMWHGVLEGATNASKTMAVAESLLSQVWPEKNAVEVIDTIGHPKHLFQEEDELRVRFRDLLFPEYDALVSAQQWT